MQARTTKKFTQKEMAMKLNVQPNVYNNIENGKSLYDPSTKKLIQNIEKQLGIKFTKNKLYYLYIYVYKCMCKLFVFQY